MGNGGSSGVSPEYEEACRLLTADELSQTLHLFRSLAAQSRSQGDFVIASVFQAYFGIRGSLGGCLFHLLTGFNEEQALHKENFVIAMAKFTKGSPSEIEELLFKLMDLTGDGFVTEKEVEACIESALETVMGSCAEISEDVLSAFWAAAKFSGPARIVDGVDEKGSMTQKDFQDWCKRVPALKRFLGSLMNVSGRIDTSVPTLIGPDGKAIMPPNEAAIEDSEAAREAFEASRERSGAARGECSPSTSSSSWPWLLRREFAWHIAGALQDKERETWQLLFSSRLHGASFNTFLGKCGAAATQGPLILLIRDAEGAVFGAFASQPLDRNSYFYGDLRSFVFSLLPAAAVYKPSGANSNVQWCAYNYTSESIPNGVGFGGQVGHFALFLDSTLEHGHSRPSVTFYSPSLSSSHEFDVDTVECWRVVLQGSDIALDDRNESVGQGTILERFKEDRAMLGLVGVATASENVQSS